MPLSLTSEYKLNEKMRTIIYHFVTEYMCVYTHTQKERKKLIAVIRMLRRQVSKIAFKL